MWLWVLAHPTVCRGREVRSPDFQEVAPCKPRTGWWRTAQRARLPTRPLRQSQIKREETLKRQAWLQYRSWSRITSGVLLSVIGAVQYGTSKVFYKIVPQFDAQELRQYLHQVMAAFSKTGQDVVMVVDRSGSHRAHNLNATLDHYHDKFRFHFYRPIVGTTSTPSKASGGS